MDTDVKPVRKRRGLKILLLVVLVLFVLFAAFILLLPRFLPVDTIRSVAQGQAANYGLDVDFKELGVSWSGSGIIRGLTVAPLPKEGGAPATLLSVDEARANLDLGSLVSGKLVVKDIDVDGFTLHVVRDADGKLNIPDFSNLQVSERPAAPATGKGARIALSAARAAEGAAVALPPIELRRLDMKNGMVVFEDAAAELRLDVGVDFVNVKGGALSDPFLLAGRILPYSGAPEKGEIPFTGNVAMVRNNVLDLENGEASFEAEINGFTLHELAARFGLGDLILAGRLDGKVKAGYASQKALLGVEDMKLTEGSLGLAPELALAIPPTAAALSAEFDPGPGVVALRDAALANDIVNLKAQGWVENLYDLAAGGVPIAAIDYSGAADFAKASGYVADSRLIAAELPELLGNAVFSGKAVLGQRENPTDPLRPTLTAGFSQGRLGIRERRTGIAADVDLTAVNVVAAAAIGASLEASARINLKNALLAATVPQLSQTPIALGANGDLVLAVAPGAVQAGVRLADARATIPQTPWSEKMIVLNTGVNMTYDLLGDALSIEALAFTVNDAMRGDIGAATIRGIQTGAPEGRADVRFSALVEHIKALFQPLAPEFVRQLAGSLRASSQISLAGGLAELKTIAEVDESKVGLVLPEGQISLDAPKTVVELAAASRLDNPLAVSLQTLKINNNGAVVGFREAGGLAVAARTGAVQMVASGKLDPATFLATVSHLDIAVGGLAATLGQGEQQTAGVSSGTMRLVVATSEQPITVPANGAGAFSLPALTAGADNLVFFRLHNGNREESDFGSVRAQLSLDGQLGADAPRIVNLRTAAMTARPFAVNSRGQVNLDTGALIAQYAARVAPAAMTSLFSYLKLPPALLDDAAITGVASFDGHQFNSKGSAQGALRLASGETNPFAMNHDLSAAYNPGDKSLAVSIRQLSGNVNSGGQAVVTLQAQPSNLLLSRSGSKGVLDIRVNGSAAPTRMLALGLVGIVPQLQEYSNVLYNTTADGVYSAWIQVFDKNSEALAVNVGGEWQGASVRVNNTPMLAESGKLAAALEGEFAYRDNRIDVTKIFLRSDAGQMQADGTARALLAAGADHAITGVANVDVDLRFVMADAARAAMAFPGIVPADLAATGRIDGVFRAVGDAHDIRIGDSAVRFQNFQARPGGLVIAIPSGAATFGGNVSLQLGAPPPAGAAPSPFDVLRLFNIANGQASLTGAQLQGKPIDNMSAAFQLQNGVATLQSARVTVAGGSGGSAAANGTIDFNSPAPVADLQVAVSNFPLDQVNEEMKDFLHFDSGVLNIPAQQGQTARVAFAGLSEDEILRTLRLDGFTFATGPVSMRTGPVLNAQLDKARAIMKQERKDESIVITLTSVTGSAVADGSGVITIPQDRPIEVVGDNTGDFRVTGTVSADHTMNMDFFVAGKLENLIGFNLPNLIPNLRSGTDEQKSRFMARMNENAAKGHYKVTVSGSLEQPNLDGIGALAARFVTDIVAAAPAEILGGLVELGKDTPGALKDLGIGAAESLLNAPDTLKNAPENILRAPQNLGKGLGRMFGVGGGSGDDSADDSDGNETNETNETNEGQGEEGESNERRLRLPFGR